MNALHVTSSKNWKVVGHLLAASVAHPVFVATIAVGGLCLIGRAQVIVVAGVLAAGFLVAVISNIIQFRRTPATTGRVFIAPSVPFGQVEQVDPSTARSKFPRPADSIHDLRRPLSPRARPSSQSDRQAPVELPAIQQATPDRPLPTPDELEDFAVSSKAKGVTNVSLTAHHAMVSNVEHTADGLVIDLVSDVVTVIQRNALGMNLGAFSETNELMSFMIPRGLLSDDVEGFMFEATMDDWNERGVTIDIEWQMNMDGDVIFAIGNLAGNSIAVGTPGAIR